MTDLSTFNGKLTFTRYYSLPRNIMFWEKEEDIGISPIYEAMSRAHFETIKRYIHFPDSSHLNTAVKNC